MTKTTACLSATIAVSKWVYQTSTAFRTSSSTFWLRMGQTYTVNRRWYSRKVKTKLISITRLKIWWIQEFRTLNKLTNSRIVSRSSNNRWCTKITWIHNNHQTIVSIRPNTRCKISSKTTKISSINNNTNSNSNNNNNTNNSNSNNNNNNYNNNKATNNNNKINLCSRARGNPLQQIF